MTGLPKSMEGSDWRTVWNLLVDTIHEVAIDSRAALNVRLRGNENGAVFGIF